MSFTSSTHPAPLFSVVGPAYVPENRSEPLGHLIAANETDQLKTNVTGLWVSFFAIVGIALINNTTAKAVQFVSGILH